MVLLLPLQMPTGVPSYPHQLATVDSDQLRRVYPRPHSFLALTLIVSVFTTLVQPPTLCCTIPAVVLAAVVSVGSRCILRMRARLPHRILQKSMLMRGFAFSRVVAFGA